MTADALDVYAIACLSGGTQRVVDTALVALVGSGRLRIAPSGELTVVSPEPRHPVEAAVLDAVGRFCTVEDLRWWIATDDRVLEVPRRLRDEGLLEVGGRAPAARRCRWRLTPTYAGLHLLHELQDAPPADSLTGSTSAMTVALHGCERLADRALLAALTEEHPATA